ncbi:MarR family winged helix-turn-helix transcriptional regulator [Actinocatenispora rupis]|uniref:DNA-binding transcriptional regulator, MarR family n=2 Tax=Actinocatenispora rupis TaxID=519421 RepID=A0A8J3J6R2_9ACTN|nr:hypothetical protein Aru02nite_21060 [Actinocatenispora rupis]
MSSYMNMERVMDTPERPIGYWLRHLDTLIERRFAATLGDIGLVRRDWQVLNTVARQPRDRAGVAAALAPFWTDDERDADGVLSDLAARGWLDLGDPVTLTATGRTAYDGVAERIGRDRETLTAGLAPGEYAEVVRVLAVMAGNAERSLAC